MTCPTLMGLKCAKLLKRSGKRVTFGEDAPKDGYPFLPKWPLKMGMGFEASAAHPVQIKFEYEVMPESLIVF